MARDIPKPEDVSDFLKRALGPQESKLTVRIPEHLHNRLRRVAEGVTEQQRGGLQDLVIILLEYGLDAVEHGELVLRKDVRATSYGIYREGD